MSTEQILKVTPHHLKRNAYLYVRQSTLKQILENTESTKRQYALQERALALGWKAEQIVVVDRDLGQSGASAVTREGFQWLVAEVGLGHAGMVMGLEVSRLARNSTDWHRLLEMCAFGETLILDEEGLYDPTQFNDRLLLGLKGTMSEAELHAIRARFQGAILSKAKRGELAIPLPVGLVYDDRGRVLLDPDQQIQASIRFIFETFRRTGSAYGTLKAFREEKLLFPRRHLIGQNVGEISLLPLTYSRVLRVLHNPRYAGVYFFGRSRTRQSPDGKHLIRIIRDASEWIALLPNAHPGYITWEEFQENLARLKENDQRSSLGAVRNSPPREGAALLQGRVLCGVCGGRMVTCYHVEYRTNPYSYRCIRGSKLRGRCGCQTLAGPPLDQAMSELLVRSMSPLALAVAIEVQQELQHRTEEAERLRHQAVERAEYEAELARRRFFRVDPDNRLVASELEAVWNAKLQELREVQQVYAQERSHDQLTLDAEKRSRIMALSVDFPKLWNDPATPARERKRMLALVLEDVTLLKDDREMTLHVRFKGGRHETLHVPVPRPYWERIQAAPEIVAEVDRLLDTHTPTEIAAILTGHGFRPPAMDRHKRKAFNTFMINSLVHSHALKPRFQRLRERGLLTTAEMCARLGVKVATFYRWVKQERIKAHWVDQRTLLFEPVETVPPAKDEDETTLVEIPYPDLLREIDQLLNDHTSDEIVDILNARRIRPDPARFRTRRFEYRTMFQFIKERGLKSRYDRLRERGFLTAKEVAEKTGLKPCTVQHRAHKGDIAYQKADSGCYLYELPIGPLTNDTSMRTTALNNRDTTPPHPE